jgi:hypothetical protein
MVQLQVHVLFNNRCALCVQRARHGQYMMLPSGVNYFV